VPHEGVDEATLALKVDRSFRGFSAPQSGHTGVSVGRLLKSFSNTAPQDVHLYS
jgi:hypothetical protein